MKSIHIKTRRFTALSAAVLLSVGLGASGAAWSDPGNGKGYKGDDWPHPKGEKQRALRQEGLQAKLAGKAQGKTHEVAKGQYVELERTGEDSIFTILVEYSDFPRNSIAEPDRSVNNTTAWTADFNRDHFMDLMFSEVPGAVSVRNFYIELSANRYTVNGDVTDWVPAPGTAASYDDDAGAFALWQLLIDSGQGWYNAQLADGMSGEEINNYLSQFDVWDRYDHDGDGNFDEPDGYIDHFQSVHAGEGEEAGGGALGGAAIWSHRWYAFFNTIGVEGPAGNLGGGVQIGQSDYWIGDYTIEPENGGVGVFAHEFAHDLGLPDLYNTGPGGGNGTGFWTLMSSGSWLGDGTEDIGTRPGHMGAWEKFQLGWLNYEVAFAGSKSEHKLGPAHANTKQAQGLFVLLPDKEVTSNIADAFAGEKFYYSGSGNGLDNRMGKLVDLGAGGGSLNAMVNFEIEYAWDFAFVAVSTDGGATYETVETNLSTADDDLTAVGSQVHRQRYPGTP
jgi:immune inhibitor A